MQEKRSFYLLLVIMGAVALVVMAVTNVILYQVAFKEKSQSLVETAQSQARLIEAMARYNRRTNRIDWETPVGERGPTSLLSERAAADTIAQLKDAHKHYLGFGDTGEFVLAGIEGEKIVFLLSHRHDKNTEPEPVPLYSEIAEPMRRALLVQSGVMQGQDYRGIEVLAAYEPVDVLNFGIVAKIDLAEIRAPFIRAALVTWLISLIVIFLGSILFRKISNPIVEKIRQSEKQYRSLVEDINEWVWMTDKDGVLIYSSPVGKDLLGYSQTDMVGKSLISLIIDESQQAARKRLTRHNHKTDFSNLHASAIHKNGHSVPMEFSASPIFAVNGEFSGYRGVARDISERLQAEKIKEDYQHTLELQVEERTADLKEINEELMNFTYIVSHDLRSPLVSIVGFSSEIKEDIQTIELTLSAQQVKDEVKQIVNQTIPESLGFINKAAEKMEGLINSILALSRMGRRELTIEQVDSAEIINRNLKAMAFQLENVDVLVQEPLPILITDAISLEQIVGNLLSNAVKFMQHGQRGKIEIWAEQEKTCWQFYMRDNGQGIAEKDIVHIFELFKRVGEQQTQGDGMGLTYVQTLVRRLGGKISCESTLAKGSLFKFSIAKTEIN